MNQENNNLNQNSINKHVNNGIPNNQLNTDQDTDYNSKMTKNYQQKTEVSNRKKKKKYWLIPILVFVIMIFSKIIQITLHIGFEFQSDVANTMFNLIFYICGFAVLPSIIFSIILSVKNR